MPIHVATGVLARNARDARIRADAAREQMLQARSRMEDRQARSRRRLTSSGRQIHLNRFEAAER